MTKTQLDNKVILFPSSMRHNTDNNSKFYNIANEWLFDEIKGTVSSRTLEWYYKTINNHFLPQLGDKDINSIQLDELLNLLSKMSVKIPRTTKLAIMLFKRIMTYAYDERYLYESWPIHRIKVIKNFKRKEIKYIPQALRGKVLELAAHHGTLFPILVTGMFIGLRPGELVALKRPKINFSPGFIDILETVTYDVDVTPDGVSNKQTVESSTKTESGMRKAKAPRIVMDALSAWKEYCIEKGLYNPNSYVFVTRDGGRRSYAGLESLYRRFSLKHQFHLSGLKITPKMPRHTCATILMENKVNPKIEQKVPGHKHIQTTLGTYSHVSDEVLDAVSQKLNSIYTTIVDQSYNPVI